MTKKKREVDPQFPNSGLKWTPEENTFLMTHAHRFSWTVIANKLGRTEASCRAHFEKIRKLHVALGTWEGI